MVRKEVVCLLDCLGNSRMNCTVCQAPFDVLSKVNVHRSQVDTVFITKQLVLPPADCKREVKPEDECFF